MLDKIKAIEEELKRTPYNKATEHHIGRLKAKLAKLKEELRKRSSQKAKKTGIRKSGDATVALVGFPSVGKSTLLNKLTNARSEVGAYDFTTLEVVPGMLEYKGARIQLLDLPGLIKGASSGRGMGREVLSIVRSADLILIVSDVFNAHNLDVLFRELYEAGIRLNENEPQIKIKVKDRGGIRISSTVKLTKISESTIREILREYRIHNAEVTIREDVTIDRFIDAILGNRKYVKAIKVINKIDLVDEDYLKNIKKMHSDAIYISAEKGTNIDMLKEAIFKSLDFIRVYMKPQGKKADLKEPMILRRGATIEDVCLKIHRDLRDNFRYAQVWGKSVKFNGQRVGLDHVVEDGDIITIVARKR